MTSSATEPRSDQLLVSVTGALRWQSHLSRNGSAVCKCSGAGGAAEVSGGRQSELVLPCPSSPLQEVVCPANPAMLISSADLAGVGSGRRSALVALEFLCWSSSETLHISSRCGWAGQYQPLTISCCCLWLY